MTDENTRRIMTRNIEISRFGKDTVNKRVWSLKTKLTLWTRLTAWFGEQKVLLYNRIPAVRYSSLNSILLFILNSFHEVHPNSKEINDYRWKMCYWIVSKFGLFLNLITPTFTHLSHVSCSFLIRVWQIFFLVRSLWVVQTGENKIWTVRGMGLDSQPRS